LLFVQLLVDINYFIKIVILCDMFFALRRRNPDHNKKWLVISASIGLYHRWCENKVGYSSHSI